MALASAEARQDLALGVGDPVENVSRILEDEGVLAVVEIQPVKIERGAVATVLLQRTNPLLRPSPRTGRGWRSVIR